MEQIIEGLQRIKEEGKLLDLAQAAGVHHSTLYRILNGEREPQLSTVRKLLVACPELAPNLVPIFLPENPPVVT